MANHGHPLDVVAKYPISTMLLLMENLVEMHSGKKKPKLVRNRNVGKTMQTLMMIQANPDFLAPQ